MDKLMGVSPIVATPFTNTGDVDYDSLKNLVGVLARGGCHALTLFGIAGEYYKLSDEESDKMVRIVVDGCKQKGIPSIISVTQHSTELAVRRAKYLQEEGADCLMLLPPFFLKPGEEAIYRHIHNVARAVDIPIMVQYAPEQTGVGISPQVFKRLTEENPNIQYYKIECKPAGRYISVLSSLLGDSAEIFVGNAGYQFIEAFDRGATGVMPGCSLYDLYLQIYRLYMEGNRQRAIEVHSALLLPILNHIRQNVEMIIAFEKMILKRRGIIETEYCRAPSFDTDYYYDRLFDELYELVLPYINQE